MSTVIKLNTKEANDLADQIERGGGNADSLRSAIGDVNNPGNHKSSILASKPDDETHIQWLRSQSPIEKGEDLECMLCHEKFDHLVSGTCESCFREWALTIKRRPAMKKLL